jgi:hypothetical protein
VKFAGQVPIPCTKYCLFLFKNYTGPQKISPFWLVVSRYLWLPSGNLPEVLKLLKKQWFKWLLLKLVYNKLSLIFFLNKKEQKKGHCRNKHSYKKNIYFTKTNYKNDVIQRQWTTEHHENPPGIHRSQNTGFRIAQRLIKTVSRSMKPL